MRPAGSKYAVLVCLAAIRLAAADPHLNGTYTATAYAQHGITASGEYAHRHVVAADPDVLPIGTRIKIKHAGRYSGEYVVADTGDKIQGRRLDIFLPSATACRKFGVKRVKVSVIELGTGTHESAKEADKVVKQDVQKDVQKAVVGNAATEDDWAAKGGPTAAGNGQSTTKSTTKTATKNATSSSTASSTATSTASSPSGPPP